MIVEDRIKNALSSGSLDHLFLGELGWDRPRIPPFKVSTAGSTYEIAPVAQKSGLHVFDIDSAQDMPPAAAQAAIDREIAKRSPERLLVFRTRINQIWRWPEMRPSGGTRLVPHEYRVGSPNEDLVQRIVRVRFELAEQDELTLADVRARVRLSFSAERVTKRFYDAFRAQHGDLLAGIEGIDDAEDRSWYASLLMNRLMFIYFIQMKGFIGGNREFLRTCLVSVRELRGQDEFYGFYRDLLIPLFHDGLGSGAHAYSDAAIAELLREVPYVNGGIFEEHPIERRYSIRVKDEYFERIFGFFDGFAWHLDTRPTGNPNEINPDVLGYVFEQYINLTASGRRENGAYYTKQDVTGYMASSTLIPRLLERLVAQTGVNPFIHLRAAATTVLDPTCGSGAFLFAALDILDEVYAAILETAEMHVRSGSPEATEVLDAITARRKEGQNIAYFRLKHACLSNLYGVDIMPEAVEIAKLRLFLTLAARLERLEEIEPLPDLDFNLKAGNLISGFKDIVDARERVADDLVSLDAVEELVPKAVQLVGRRSEFVELLEQAEDEDEIRSLKGEIIEATRALRETADRAYKESEGATLDIKSWREITRPFHWFIEFPHVIERGGFDVVIGNPPYVRRGEVAYSYSGFETDRDPDIFAPCMERAASLCAPDGGFAMIVPIAFQFSADYNAARRVVRSLVPWRCTSTFSRNPSALFTAGLGVRSTIVIGSRSGEDAGYVTETRRWVEDFRPHLFHSTRYSLVPDDGDSAPWPRLGSALLVELYQALRDVPGTVGHSTRRHGAALGFKQTALYYLSIFLDEPPAWLPSGERTAQTKVGWLRFESDEERDVAYVLLSGRLGVWWWAVTGDDFDLTAQLLKSFPVSVESVAAVWSELQALAAELRTEQPKHPIVTLYAQKEMGNYDMLRCRHITDRADQLVLETLGLEGYWPDILAADARLLRMTGERPGTEREWPFPWTPGQATTT